jgi:hypothetical protein
MLLVPYSSSMFYFFQHTKKYKKARVKISRGLFSRTAASCADHGFLVRQARFERATHGLEDRCSIQLSY